MSPFSNGRILYNEHPLSRPVPGRTVIYDTLQTIDIGAVPLNGGFLMQTIVLSSDPYLRTRMRPQEIKDFAPPFVIGQPLDNYGIGLVLRSEDDKYPPGIYLYGFHFFQQYSVRNDTDTIFPWIPLQKPQALSWSLFVGTLGMPGQTAYFGWKALVEEKAKMCKTLFVSVGGGPVGSFVIQYAKMNHPQLKIIASAGTQPKLDFMKSIGADVVFNYKTENPATVLAEHGPIGIYWDMTAGSTLDAAVENMENYGLIIACGATSVYNTPAKDRPQIQNFDLLFRKSITVHGFRSTDFMEQYLMQFFAEVPTLVLDGKIKPSEQRYLGLEKAEEALIDVHTGDNFGKAVIIVSDDS